MDRREELATASRHVDRAEQIVERQLMLIARLSADGHETETAHQLLEKLELTLATMRAHRDLVRSEIEAETGERVKGGDGL